MEQDKNLTAEIQQEETLVGTIPPVTFDEFTPPSYEEWKHCLLYTSPSPRDCS